MLAVLSQLLGPFFLSCGPAVVVGVGCYVLVRLVDETVPDFLEVVIMPCAFLLLFIVPITLLAAINFPPLFLLFPLSVLAACGDRAISTEQDTLGWHYWRLCIAQVLSLLFAPLLYVLLDWVGRIVPVAFGVRGSSLSLVEYLVGLLAGPIVAPIFIWLWRSSQMRPGIDRLLTPSEELNRLS